MPTPRHRRSGLPFLSVLLPAAVALAIAVGGGGCGARTTSDRVLVFIDPPDAEALLVGGGGLLGLSGPTRVGWVDPRLASTHAAGHIPGAIHLPFQELESRHRELDAFDVIIVYGDDYNDPLAEGMSKRLIELGHDDVRTLRGGVRAWTDAGHELATGG